jgi:hypothetical protein
MIYKVQDHYQRAKQSWIGCRFETGHALGSSADREHPIMWYVIQMDNMELSIVGRGIATRYRKGRLPVIALATSLSAILLS